MVKYGLSNALAGGVQGFFQGRELAERDTDRERRRAREDKQESRADAAEGRAQAQEQRAADADERAKGLYPFQMTAASAGANNAVIQGQQNQMQLDQMRQQADDEGLVQSMRYLKAGMPERAYEHYNMSGKGRLAPADQGGIPVQGKDGNWTAKGADGKDYTFNPDNVLNALKASSPTGTWHLNSDTGDLLNTITGEVKKKYGSVKPLSSATGVASSIQETEAIFNHLDPKPGETDNQRWLRAAHMAATKQTTDKNEAAGKFYSSIMAALVSDGASKKEVDEAHAIADQLTEDFKKTYLTGSQYGDDPASAGTTQAPGSQFTEPNMKAAFDAIQAGASPAAVAARLKTMGYTDAKIKEITDAAGKK